jgi:hypothetical protein
MILTKADTWCVFLYNTKQLCLQQLSLITYRLKKNPVMSNTDRFFYLNSTVFLLEYLMIIVPPYSDMGHILYIPWILRINLYKRWNGNK